MRVKVIEQDYFDIGKFHEQEANRENVDSIDLKTVIR